MDWTSGITNIPYYGMKPFFSDFESTKIYRYILSNDVLKFVIPELFNKIMSPGYFMNDLKILSFIYEQIFDTNFDIVYEIIDGSSSIDELVIGLVAIDKNNYDILGYILSKGFDINKIFYESNLLSYSVTAKNLEMCRYLIDKGANPFSHENGAFITSCHTDTEIFDYFMENYELSNEQLEKAFISCLYGDKCNFGKLKKIFDKGLDVNNYKQRFFDKIGGYNVGLFKFLMENGLELKSNVLLGSACMNDNYELAKLCLDNGLRPNNDILNIVCKKIKLPLMKLFLQYGIDFSSVTMDNQTDILIEEFEKNGLDKTTFLNLFLQDKNVQSNLMSQWMESTVFMNGDIKCQ